MRVEDDLEFGTRAHQSRNNGHFSESKSALGIVWKAMEGALSGGERAFWGEGFLVFTRGGCLLLGLEGGGVGAQWF